MTPKSHLLFLAKGLGEVTFIFFLHVQKHSQSAIKHTHTKPKGTARNTAFRILYNPIQRNSLSTKTGLVWYDLNIWIQRNAKRNGIRKLIYVLLSQCTASLSFYQDPWHSWWSVSRLTQQSHSPNGPLLSDVHRQLVKFSSWCHDVFWEYYSEFFSFICLFLFL